MRHRGPRSLASLLALLGLLAPLLSGCGAAPTPTASPTATAAPTQAPTPTPIPSPTPLPLAAWVEEADALLWKSDYAGAEAAYRRVLEVDPAYLPAHLGLCRLLSWPTGRQEEQFACAQKAVEIAPDDALAHAALAEAHLRLWQGEEALAAAQEAVEIDPRSALGQVALADAYRFQRDYDKALQAARQAVGIDPGQARGYNALGWTYFGMAEYGRARAALQRALDLEPGYVPRLAGLAMLDGQTGRIEEAEAGYLAALELSPDDVALVAGLAEAYVVDERFADTQKQVDRLMKLAPERPEPYLAKGQLHVAKGEYEEAVDDLQVALEKEPDSYRALVLLADAYGAKGECDLLAQQAERLMALQPRMADGRIRQGLARLCGGDTSKAVESLQKAIDMEPYDSVAHHFLGLTLSSMERWDEATLALAEALRLSAEPAGLHVELGEMLASQEDAEGARAEYEIALRLDPRSLPAYLDLAILELQEGDYAGTQAYAEGALDIQEDNVLGTRLRAFALAAQGQAERARPLLRLMAAMDPEDSWAQLYLALVLRDLGSYAEASKILQSYAELEPDFAGTPMIAQLSQALAEGYVIADGEGTAKAEALAEELFFQKVEASIADLEGRGRTLVLRFVRDPAETEEELLSTMAADLVVVSMVIARIDPPVAGGALVRVVERDQPAYEATAPLTDLKLFGDSISTWDQLISAIDFSRLLGEEAEASVAEIEEDVSALRSLEAKQSVPFNSLSEAELETRITSGIDAQAHEANQSSDALLTMLGVLTPDQDLETILTDLYSEELAGFYDPEEEAFYLIETEAQSTSDELTIAHEYVHALQDQSFGLEDLQGQAQDSDEEMAYDALVEGDATLAMWQYAEAEVGVFDSAEAWSQASGMESEALDATPEFIRRLQGFPYVEGHAFVSGLHEDGGWEAVDRAYAKPPQSTEQILHPELYRSGHAPRKVDLPDLAGALGGDWRVAEEDLFGEIGLLLSLGEYLGPAASALAAEGWGGDRYALLASGDGGPLALAVRSEWDDAEEAGQFWGLLRAYMAHRPGYEESIPDLTGELTTCWWQSDSGLAYAELSGEEVVWLLGPDEATINNLLEELR